MKATPTSTFSCECVPHPTHVDCTLPYVVMLGKSTRKASELATSAFLPPCAAALFYLFICVVRWKQKKKIVGFLHPNVVSNLNAFSFWVYTFISFETLTWKCTFILCGITIYSMRNTASHFSLGYTITLLNCTFVTHHALYASRLSVNMSWYALKKMKLSLKSEKKRKF